MIASFLWRHKECIFVMFEYAFAVHKTSYDYVKSFRNEFNVNSTIFSSYVWEMKNRKNVTQALTQEVLRTVKAYSNITKRCSLCLHEQLAIITYQGIIQSKMEVNICFWAPNLGLSPKYD